MSISPYQPLPATLPARTALLWVALFNAVTDRWPRRLGIPWPILVTRFLTHTRRRWNDGPLYSPTRYRRGAPRGSRFVEALYLLILEFDFGAPAFELLEAIGVTFAAHTTFSHWLQDARHPIATPHWRLVIPLARPVPAAAWRTTYDRARLVFPDADPACSDAARMQRWPSCPLDPPAPPETRWIDTGAWLDPDSLPPLPAPPRPFRSPWPLPSRDGVAMPGTDRRVAAAFDRQVSIVDVMTADGWTDLGEHDGRVHLLRPGKDYTSRDARCSATACWMGRNVAYIFSSSAWPLEAGTSYSPFRYFTTVHHRGDAHAAAQDLRRRGYGG